MLNQIVLVGRITKNPELMKTDKGKNKLSIDLAVQRSFKNVDGVYDTDFIRCILWNNIAENTCEYCKKGDLVGIKGRLQTRNYEKDEEIKYMTEVIAEKVTFLASKLNSEEKSKIDKNK